MIEYIENFINNQNLDIRVKKNNPRFLDQKCTPDVISFIADMIIGFNDSEFSRTDVQEQESFAKLTTFVFGKPSPKNKNVKNEYDKFIGQTLEMFSYSGILKKAKHGKTNKYIIVEKDILEYIAVRPMNACNFIIIYFKKFIQDSSLGDIFNNFFDKQNKESFNILKEKFEFFMLKNSNIGTRGSETGGITEIRRIFPKLLNPLSLSKNLKGTCKGHISKGIITSAELMYNRVNFRDDSKLKNISRKEQDDIDKNKSGYNKYQIKKAMQWVKRLHPYSEVNDGLHGTTSTIHHIFPKSEFPAIACYIENLIALTSGQHLDKAHPNGNTQKIDPSYQFICLRAKLNTIRNFEEEYSKENFIYVVNTGFGWLNTEKEIGLKVNFDVIDKNITLYYKTKQ